MRGAGVMGLSLLLCAGAAFAQVDLGTQAQQDEGKQLYDKYCSQCHGLNGDGVGHATYRVLPRPRDFTSAKYKFRTTPSGALPTDADLKKVIKDGLSYTSMPAFPIFSDSQIQDIIYYLKTFSEDFKDAERYGQPIDIPAPPPVTEESVTRGRDVFVENGCGACHGDLGRGDGMSAPTLEDDFGNRLRPVDMTMRWTFRAGASREDIYRTFSTGVNGTPMPSYADSLSIDDRWNLVDYIHSLGDGDEPGYDELVTAKYTVDEVDIAVGADEDISKIETLFAEAQMSRFALMGQITEIGRNFYPAVTHVDVKAIYNPKEIAFKINWHDMRAERAGSNGPSMEVLPWDEENAVPSGAAADDPWGDDAVADDDPWGDAEVEEEDDGGDFWGEEEDDGGEEAEGYSDALALQFPSATPSGNRKPYFIFGDIQNSVDLWFIDLARDAVQQYVGRGSAAIEGTESDEFETYVNYDKGLWTVVIKRELRSSANVSFTSDTFVPLAVSVWDGFSEERGNKRALSRWLYVYLEPTEQVSPWGPMLQAALGVFVVELLLVFYIRRRKTQPAKETAGEPSPQAAR